MRRHYPLPFGAGIVSGGVRFRLWPLRAAGMSPAPASSYRTSAESAAG
jgi:hypothetical protein